MTAALGWAGSASMFVIVRNLETLSSVWSRHYLASAQVASHDYQAVHVYLLRALDSLGPNPECRITPDAGKPTSPRSRLRSTRLAPYRPADTRRSVSRANRT